MADEDDDISALLSEPSGTDDQNSIELFNEVSVVLSESVGAAAERTEPSADEVAWADSCLNFDPDPSDDKWSAMRDALLDALSSYHTSYETSSATFDNETIEERDEEGDAENSLQSEEIGATLIHPEDHYSFEEAQREGATLEDSLGSQEDIDSSEIIFKVWDLEIPYPDDEEDELIQQVKKLLAGSSREVILSPPDGLSTVLSQEDTEELVTSMGDLSLKRFD